MTDELNEQARQCAEFPALCIGPCLMYIWEGGWVLEKMNIHNLLVLETTLEERVIKMK